MPLTDSPINMPTKQFTVDAKGHRQNNSAIEQFGQASALSFVPIAGIVAWVGTITAPPGYLECDGSDVSRTEYAALFDTIGTQFGVGDGSTTFGIPTYAECVALYTGGHIHGGVTAGAADTAAATNPSYGTFIIRTGAL